MRNPDVPEALDGWWILHRMFALDRRKWDALSGNERRHLAGDAQKLFCTLHSDSETDVSLTQLLGHKADLMLTHYAKSFEELAAVQTRVDKLMLSAYLQPKTSYVSLLELGLYEATAKIHAELKTREFKLFSPEWNQAFDVLLGEQAQSPRNAGRLFAKVPPRRYVCFYPMDKKRGESVNWYMLPYEQRAALMTEHGKIGRSFHGLVTQVISGSVGFDDWEWGVDLYADDPVVFKKLIYEMRFDEASAKYAAFGEFYTGVQFSPKNLGVFLDGEGVPTLEEPACKP
ncbi:MAG: heme-dependent peroxidase [Candidatus Eremiobacteraeota bacterium]|nr:heme-dependent peroxidase [Candidatus Eremiobacteraeota bacterium]